jgi:hypothetical protein
MENGAILIFLIVGVNRHKLIDLHRLRKMEIIFLILDTGDGINLLYQISEMLIISKNS